MKPVLCVADFIEVVKLGNNYSSVVKIPVEKLQDDVEVENYVKQLTQVEK